MILLTSAVRSDRSMTRNLRKSSKTCISPSTCRTNKWKVLARRCSTVESPYLLFPPVRYSKNRGRRNQDPRCSLTRVECTKPPGKCLVMEIKFSKTARNKCNPQSAIFSVNHQYAQSAECYPVIKVEVEPGSDDRHKGQR